MKALTFHAHGGPEVLRVEDVPTPEPGPGEVRIDVKAVALNPVSYTHLTLPTNREV